MPTAPAPQPAHAPSAAGPWEDFRVRLERQRALVRRADLPRPARAAAVRPHRRALRRPALPPSSLLEEFPVPRFAVDRETTPTLLSVAAIPGLAPAQVVVEVAGEVSSATAPLLQLCLDGQVDQAAVRELVVDLRRVSFLGAAGVRVLQRARRRCEARGARFVVRPRRGRATGAGRP